MAPSDFPFVHLEELPDQLAAERKAQERGSELNLPLIKARLEEGEALQFWDRTNAVFTVVLGKDQGENQIIEDEDLSAASWRSMHLFSAFTEIEARLGSHGKSGAGAAQMVTGAPGELDGLEQHLSLAGGWGRITCQDGLYRLELVKVARTQKTDRYRFVFQDLDLKQTYAKAEAFGAALHQMRYTLNYNYLDTVEEIAQASALVERINTDLANCGPYIEAFVAGSSTLAVSPTPDTGAGLEY